MHARRARRATRAGARGDTLNDAPRRRSTNAAPRRRSTNAAPRRRSTNAVRQYTRDRVGGTATDPVSCTLVGGRHAFFAAAAAGSCWLTGLCAASYSSMKWEYTSASRNSVNRSPSISWSFTMNPRIWNARSSGMGGL